MTFNFGPQNAGVINNVGRDQHVHGGQQGAYAGGDPVALVRELREALAAQHLPADVAPSVAAQVEALEQVVGEEQPDRPRAASLLERLTRTLVSAGPLATAAVSLAAPLERLARWLGPMGESVLRLLPGL